MYRLVSANEIAHGNDRAIFRHPERPGCCIKVPRFPERGSQQNEREKVYFENLLRRGMVAMCRRTTGRWRRTRARVWSST